ncbi:hypothetical protein C815_00816 [Firmicutes bacterium M10-2]|nr:hypothetical protein C815_00816 [Firmicutes bacterium M10-2]
MNKYENLISSIKNLGRVAIAYSGGCDSDFLLHVCVNTLGKENVFPILVKGEMMSKEDLEEAIEELNAFDHEIIEIDVFSIPEFEWNDKKRCYFCKKNIMSQIKNVASLHGFANVCDGQNADDQHMYRPGQAACQELGILSPLAKANLSKEEIRAYSKELGLKTHAKPANACLASRFDYGTHLTKEKLKRVEKAEDILHSFCIFHVRLRDMGNTARIECEPKDFEKVIVNREQIAKQIKQLGYLYVTLDLCGIVSGGFDQNGK